MKSQIEILTKKQRIISGFTAAGLSNKEIADKMGISVHTVVVHQRIIHERLRINKSTELTKWWFCTMFDISEDDIQNKLKSIGATMLMLLLSVNMFVMPEEFRIRTYRSRTRRTRTELSIETNIQA